MIAGSMPVSQRLPERPVGPHPDIPVRRGATRQEPKTRNRLLSGWSVTNCPQTLDPDRPHGRRIAFRCCRAVQGVRQTMRDQSGSGWKSGIATFVVALITVGVAWWFTRRETGAVPVWSSDLERSARDRKAAPGSTTQAGPSVSFRPQAADTPSAGAASDPAPSGEASPPAPGPHGDDSALPLPDGSPPPGFPIKGNPNSKLYHSPESPYYGRTRAQVYFRTSEAAEAAGFQHWNSRRRGR